MRTNEQLEVSIRKKIEKLCEKFGELKYKVIKHRIVETTQPNKKINIDDLNILTLKILTKEIKDNAPFLVTRGYAGYIEYGTDLDLQNKFDILNPFAEDVIWVKIDNLDSYDIDNLIYYFSTQEIIYSLKYGLKLVDTDFIYDKGLMKDNNSDVSELYKAEYNDANKLDIKALTYIFDDIFTIIETEFIWDKT